MARGLSRENPPTGRPPRDSLLLTLTAQKQLILDYRSCFALMDTGADKNIMYKDFADSLGLDFDTSERPFFDRHAGGQSVQALGKVHLRFRLEERGRWYEDVFFIVPHETTMDVLLGGPFLQRERIMVYQEPSKTRVLSAITAIRRCL